MDSISLSVTYFAILLGFGVLLANLLKKRNIPDTFFLLLLGMLFGPTVFSNPAVTQYISIKLVDVQAMGNIPDFLRTLALILVVFIGTFNLNFRVFKRYSSISLKLAVIGVLFNTFFLGLAANFFFGMDLIFAMLLGAVIGGTGSGVVFAFEKALKKSKNALTILQVESIFNSPMSVLIPVIILDLLFITPGAMIEPLKYLSQFWLMITVGVGTGLIIGLSVAFLLRNVMKEYTYLMMFAIALLTYALAVGVGGSGMLAVAICGLVAGNFVLRDKDEKEELIQFQDQLYEMLRISVFTMLGAQATLLMGLGDFLLIMLFFALVVALRPVFIIPLMGDLRKKFTRKDFLLLSLVAPRGLASAAMIPIVAAAVITAGQPAVAERMINIVFMVVLLSVLFSTIVAALASMKRFQKDKDEGKKEDEEKEPQESKDAGNEEDLSKIFEADK